jgi:major type 1 subunit fimbrin (pilin)
MKALPSQAGRAAALVLGLAAAGFAQAQTPTTGTINFTGSIKDVPCEIDTSATSSTSGWSAWTTARRRTARSCATARAS